MQRMQPAGIRSVPYAVTQLISIFLEPSVLYTPLNLLRRSSFMSRADRYLKACKKESVDCTPVWIMRQAGRYLEEYRAVRAKHSFIEVCKTPELVVEITLQPVRRFEIC